MNQVSLQVLYFRRYGIRQYEEERIVKKWTSNNGQNLQRTTISETWMEKETWANDLLIDREFIWL